MSGSPDEASARLRLLYEVTTLRTGAAADRLEAALEAVARLLSLDIGVVTRVEGTTATIAQVYSPDGALRPGESMPLEETYCDLTLKAGGVLSISRIGRSPYARQPYYQRSGNESYIGAAVTVRGELYGTLGFCGFAPRTPAFATADEELVEMLARWVGVMLEVGIADAGRSESEARFATLFYASPVPVILTTLAEGRFLDLNAKAEVTLGFSREEVLGRTTLELGLWSERPFGGREGMLRLLEEQGSLRDVEMELRRKDGALRTVLVSFEILEGRAEPALLTTLVDLTERNLMERRLRASEARFRGAFHDAAVGMVMTARDGRLMEVNASLCRMLGYSREELLALGVQNITHPEDLETDLAKAREVLVGEIESYQLEKRYLHKGGHVVWGHLSVSAVHGEEGSVAYLLAQVQDVTERKRYEEQVRVMAYHDELTGLHNRRFFFEQAPLRLAASHHRGEPVALVYLDLNGFKEVNDTLGHWAGDDLLRRVATRFRESLREGDLLARFGGDEFVVLLVNFTEAEARGVAARLGAGVKQVLRSSRDGGTSVGVVFAPNGSDDLGELLRLADKAMYRAKGRKAHEPYAVEVVHISAPDIN